MGLELDMSETRLHEHGYLGRFRMKEALEIAHATRDFLRRRHKRGIARSRAADPVLAAAKLAGVPPFATPAGEQHSMDLTQRPQGEREAFLEACEAMVHRRDVVRHLADIVQGNAGRFFRFVEQ